jgi:hypothetical protein
MTLEGLENALPNGLHDAEVQRILPGMLRLFGLTVAQFTYR